MAKKIYDIFPPHIADQRRSNEEKEENPRSRLICGLNFSNQKCGIGLGLILLLIFLGIYFLFVGANVEVWPEVEVLEYRGEVKIDADSLYLDFENRIIPATILEIEKEESRSFVSSGIELTEKRAEGVLRVYNNHSTSLQILVAETRFVSADGKLFRSTERISVPGQRYEGGKLVPGEAEVLVRAAEPGADYNIDKKSKFSIPGLQGTPMYTTVYAENPEPISGGYTGEDPLITQDDIETAKAILLSDVLKKAEQKIESETTGFIFIEELKSFEVSDEISFPGPGENSESFEYGIRVNYRAMAFRESDMKDLLENILLEMSKVEAFPAGDIFSGKKAWEEGFDINYELLLKEDREAVIEILVSGIVYPVLREDTLKKEISGKGIDEIEIVLSDHVNIAKAEISFWPPWMRKMPGPGKIKIKTNINGSFLD